MRFIMAILILGSIGSVAYSAESDTQLYKKDGATFVPVTKRDAVVGLLNEKASVFKCVEQRLTSKLTLKAKSSD